MNSTFSLFSHSFALAEASNIFSWPHFLGFLSSNFCQTSFNLDLVRYFVKIIETNRRLAVFSTLAIYKTSWEERSGNYWAERKNIEIPKDKI